MSLKDTFLKYYPEITGLFVFFTYMFTIGHSVGENDSGELALAQATLSIPHPTGYPLFVLIGYIFNLLPLPFTTIFKLNLLGAIWCVLAVVMVIRISSLILNNLNILLNRKGRTLIITNNLKNSEKIIASVFAGLMLAYSATFWLQSSRVEVYSLQIFITSIIIFFTLKTLIIHVKSHNSELPASSIFKIWFLVFVFIGLGFANHMMTIYLLPAIFFLYFKLNKLTKTSLQTFALLSLSSSIVSVIFYFGMMMRANMDPPWSWGNTSNLLNLIEHITAKEYAQHAFQGLGLALKQSEKLLKMLSFNFSDNYIFAGEFSFSLVLGVSGLLLSFILIRPLIIYFYSVILTSVFMALSYNIPDINEYFLVLFLLFSLFSVIPIIMIFRLISYNRIFIYSFVLILNILIIIQIVINYNYTNRSDIYLYEDFFKAAMSDLPENAILFTNDWVAFTSPGLFYQHVEGIRKDINIISPDALFIQEWYRKIKQIEVLDSTRTIIFKDNIYLGYDVITGHIRNGVIYLPPKTKAIPLKYLYKLVSDNKYYQTGHQNLVIRLKRNYMNAFDSYMNSIIPSMIEQRITYEIQFNKIKEAQYFYEFIKNNFPEYEISEVVLNLLDLHISADK